MEFITTKFKHDTNANTNKHEEPHHPARGSLAITPQKTRSPSPSQNVLEPEPERDLVSKLIVGSGAGRPSSSCSSSASSSAATNATRQKLLALTQREAELRYQLDLLTEEKTENEGFFATLRARFDREAERDKGAVRGTETPGVFWERFVGREEMERKKREVERREGVVRGELAVVEGERKGIEEGRL